MNNKVDKETIKIDKKNNGVDLVQLNKMVFKLVAVFIVMLIIMTISKLGMQFKTIIGVTELICTFIVTAIASKIVKTDEQRAVALVLIPGVAGNVYSLLMGGSSTAFIVNYLIIALASLYFSSKILN